VVPTPCSLWISLEPYYCLRIVSTGTELRPGRARDKAYVENIFAAIHKAKV
jgi:hypothetical protein